MMKDLVKRTMIALVAFAATAPAVEAQDKPEVSVGADLVSEYVWRGQKLGNVSIQPTASIAWKGFSLTAWGSASFDDEDSAYGAKEFDLTLGYATGGFSISLTDYSFSSGMNNKSGMSINGKYFHYGSSETLHVFEAQVGYDFGPVAVNWYTNIGGNDGLRSNGKRAYSSYVSVAAPFTIGGVDCSATVGATPWETSFYNGGKSGFAVSEVSLEASKTIQITEKFGLPLFARAIWNPATENAFFVVGLSL